MEIVRLRYDGNIGHVRLSFLTVPSLLDDRARDLLEQAPAPIVLANPRSSMGKTQDLDEVLFIDRGSLSTYRFKQIRFGSGLQCFGGLPLDCDGGRWAVVKRLGCCPWSCGFDTGRSRISR